MGHALESMSGEESRVGAHRVRVAGIRPLQGSMKEGVTRPGATAYLAPATPLSLCPQVRRDGDTVALEGTRGANTGVVINVLRLQAALVGKAVRGWGVAREVSSGSGNGAVVVGHGDTLKTVISTCASTIAHLSFVPSPYANSRSCSCTQGVVHVVDRVIVADNSTPASHRRQQRRRLGHQEPQQEQLHAR